MGLVLWWYLYTHITHHHCTCWHSLLDTGNLEILWLLQFVRCVMALSNPMHCNKPNITYLQYYLPALCPENHVHGLYQMDGFMLIMVHTNKLIPWLTLETLQSLSYFSFLQDVCMWLDQNGWIYVYDGTYKQTDVLADIQDLKSQGYYRLSQDVCIYAWICVFDVTCYMWWLAQETLSQELCAQFIFLFCLFWCDRFYPYPSGLIHWHWGYHTNNIGEDIMWYKKKWS